MQTQKTTPSSNAKTRVLVVEDEPGIAGFVRRGLLFEGYAVDVATEGRAALSSLRDHPPDVVVLDLMLPEIDGIEITRRVRSAETAEGRPPVPILMLTARDGIPDRVAGLEAGADDYLVKPFAFDELLARIRALLRRSSSTTGGASPTETFAFDDLTLDLTARSVQRGGRDLRLTTREFDLLTLLLRHPNQVLGRSQILDRVWGPDFFGDSNVIEVFIANLRRELEANGEPRIIQTVRGVGYVLRRSG
ncbi:MAG: two-component system, OmpR family, response regulator MprA [Thermomicrobiales bacterium]|jgi:two-component system response regulator MprA|nr:two-component system, OmpR family, response regulator MprA [Thermomicrobiales bacterium]